MKDIKTILTESNSLPTWDEFISAFRRYNDINKTCTLSMHEIFNRPSKSRTGLPTVHYTPNIKRYTTSFMNLTIKAFDGKNIKYLALGAGSDWIQIQMCTPLKDGIVGFPIGDMQMFITIIGEKNIIKIYDFICNI